MKTGNWNAGTPGRMHVLIKAALIALLFHACTPGKKVVTHREYSTASGLRYLLTERGEGREIGPGDLVFMHYTASLEDGTVFDDSYIREEAVRIRMGTDQLIPGLKEGLLRLREGDHATLYIPPGLAYGEEGYGPVPPDAGLIYKLEVLTVLPPPESLAVEGIRKHETPTGLAYSLVENGKGRPLERGMRVTVHYTAYLSDETVFDSSYERNAPISFILGQGMVIPGWEEGLLHLSEGDKARLWVPHHLAYGEKGRGPIPANEDLIFDLFVLEAEMPDAPVLKPVDATDALVRESGLTLILLKEGTGPLPEKGQVLHVHYSGFTSDGRLFDSSVQRKEPLRFVLGARQVIPGWEEGFSLLREGSRARFIVPPHLAYGQQGKGPVPPGETLTFDVELLFIEK